MEEKLPLISVITVCFNAEKDIEKTILSVLNQTNTDYEYIIVDGKSMDNTLHIIDQYMDGFIRKGVHIDLVSEQDNGIFDAMNKGIKKAKGIWINFMNAGDTFYDDDILKKIKLYLEKSNADIVYGNCYRYNKYYSYLKVPRDIDLLKQKMAISHQAAFIKKNVQEKYLFSLKYRMASDYDLFLRLYLQGYKFEYVPVLICRFSLDGVSNSKLVDAYKETYMVRVDNGVVNPHSLGAKVTYICGYTERLFEMMLPTDLKWKLKAVKKKVIDIIKNK